MIKLKKEGEIMKRKYKILVAILVIVSIVQINIPHKPKLISNVTTLDTAYMTILVDKSEIKNIKKLEEKLLQMCREDSFDEMKLHTAEHSLAERLVFTIYVSKLDLKMGKPYITIKKDARD
jgi:hypothetical protein